MLVTKKESIDSIFDGKGRTDLNKPFRTAGEPRKFGVYIKNEKKDVVLVRFGQPETIIQNCLFL
jgi:hypothetical protein